MATLDSAAALILPRPAAPRRNSGRRSAAASPAVPRGAAVRRRVARPEAGPETDRFSGEQIDTWILQGLIWAAMAGMLVWFHAPLGAALRGLL
jgi:hypothetical protein